MSSQNDIIEDIKKNIDKEIEYIDSTISSSISPEKPLISVESKFIDVKGARTLYNDLNSKIYLNTSSIETKAPLISPVFSGTPTYIEDISEYDNGDTVANTRFVQKIKEHLLQDMNQMSGAFVYRGQVDSLSQLEVVSRQIDGTLYYPYLYNGMEPKRGDVYSILESYSRINPLDEKTPEGNDYVWTGERWNPLGPIIHVDEALDDQSINPVENLVVTKTFDDLNNVYLHKSSGFETSEVLQKPKYTDLSPKHNYYEVVEGNKKFDNYLIGRITYADSAVYDDAGNKFTETYITSAVVGKNYVTLNTPQTISSGADKTFNCAVTFNNSSVFNNTLSAKNIISTDNTLTNLLVTNSAVFQTTISGNINGNAVTANRINTTTAIGNTSTPIYMTSTGTFTTCDVMTDNSVDQNLYVSTETTKNFYYPFIFKPNNNESNITSSVQFATTITANLTEGIIKTNYFDGMATQAVYDSNGNNIVQTYLTKQEGGTYQEQINNLATSCVELKNDVERRSYDSEVVHLTQTETITGTKNFTEVITVPTMTGTDSSTNAANTAFVQTAIAKVVDNAPKTLDTLRELAEALGEDPNFATTMINQLALKANDDGVVHKIGDTMYGYLTISSPNSDFAVATTNCKTRMWFGYHCGTDVCYGANAEFFSTDAGGYFIIHARNSIATASVGLTGKPDGILLWNGKNVITQEGNDAHGVIDGTLTVNNTVTINNSTLYIKNNNTNLGLSISNSTITALNDNNYVSIHGGDASDDAYLALYGKSSDDEGMFDLCARNSSTKANHLFGKTNGKLTWNNQELPCPTGSIIWHSTQNLPSGYLVCNGSAVSRTTYADLFNIIGTLYGTGDGSTTFNLPNLINRFPEGGQTNVGTYYNAGLPNITGHISAAGDTSFDGFVGCFYDIATRNGYRNQTNIIASGLPDDFGFDASKFNSIYGNSSTVQPNALILLPCIKY